MAINSVVLVGRLTRDPELRYTTNASNPVCNFSIAVDREFANKNGEREVDFINCVAWNCTAEFIPKYFEKGDLIGVKGSLTSRKYTDKDGNNRISYEVLAIGVSFISKKERSLQYTQGDASEPEQKDNSQYFTIDDDQNVPF